MIKLILCLLCGLVMAALVLELRQQRLELNYQANKLHGEIEKQQARLWSQQKSIAEWTAPNAIAQRVKQLDLKMGPRAAAPPQSAHQSDSDAE